MTNYENLRNKKQKKYIKKLKAENALLQFKLNGANGVVARQMDHIATLNRQIEQQDLYMNRYMEELAVLKSARCFPFQRKKKEKCPHHIGDVVVLW